MFLQRILSFAIAGLRSNSITLSVTKRFRWTGVNNVSTWNYFTDDEVKGLSVDLVDKLDRARNLANVAFVITSGFRSPADNERVLGVDASAHVKGLAVDLRCSDSSSRLNIVQALLTVGFNRVGVYDKHIHCDIDKDLPQDVMWVGVSH